jgi:DNA-binding response OmpR family regulator
MSKEHDAVLLDLNLPKRDGIEVLRSLRAERSKALVIILTARDAPADRIAGLDADADDYLTKPFGGAEDSRSMRQRTWQPTEIPNAGSPVVSSP